MEWKINRGSRECVHCVKKFSEDEEYYSALFDENNVFLRKDFCIPCWNHAQREQLFSFWRTRIPKANKPAKKLINTDVLLDMFLRLEGKNETHQKNLRYVIGLYLIRKKILKIKSFLRQGADEFIILSYAKAEREFSVFNQNLKEEEIESITSEMNQLLDYSF